MLFFDPVSFLDPIWILDADIFVSQESSDEFIEDIARGDAIDVVISEYHDFLIIFNGADDFLYCLIHIIKQKWVQPIIAQPGIQKRVDIVIDSSYFEKSGQQIFVGIVVHYVIIHIRWYVRGLKQI